MSPVPSPASAHCSCWSPTGDEPRSDAGGGRLRTHPDAPSEAFFVGPGKGRDMELEREALLQIVVGASATIAFIAMVAAVGMAYNAANLGETGSLAIVGIIVVFVLVLAVLGMALGERMSTD